MLNVDYKILAKTLATRIKPILDYTICPEQTGFMQGRGISYNIVKTFEVIQYAKHSNIPAVIMTIEFEKCFDRTKHNTILGALKYFGFGEIRINWIGTVLQTFKYVPKTQVTPPNGLMHRVVVVKVVI